MLHADLYKAFSLYFHVLGYCNVIAWTLHYRVGIDMIWSVVDSVGRVFTQKGKLIPFRKHTISYKYSFTLRFQCIC